MTGPLPPKAAERGNVLPFRRRGPAVKRRRRSLTARLLRPFAGALGIVGVPAWALFWLLTTPRLAFSELVVMPDPATVSAQTRSEQEIDPLAVRRVPEIWVTRAIAPYDGRNLLRLPLDEIGAQVAQHPWVQGVDVRKELPHRLWVAVREHRPAALLQEDGRLHYVDAEGVEIAPLGAEDGAVDLLTIDPGAPARAENEQTEAAADSGGRERALRRALALSTDLATLAPVLSEGLSEIEVLGHEDFRLVTTALPFPLLVRAGTLQEQLRHLETLLPQITSRYGVVAAVDLRFARRMIVQPSAQRIAPAFARGRL